MASRQINDRVEEIEAPNHAAVQMVGLVIRFAEGKDDGETEHGILTGLYESPADRALTPFQRRAFSSRGSPSAWLTRPPAGLPD